MILHQTVSGAKSQSDYATGVHLTAFTQTLTSKHSAPTLSAQPQNESRPQYPHRPANTWKHPNGSLLRVKDQPDPMINEIASKHHEETCLGWS